MAAFNENFLTGNDFEAVLVFFCCYGSGGNPSEVVQQITTDETMVPDLLFFVHSHIISVTVQIHLQHC